MPEPLVSVVVATYNRPTRLARLLESLRAQTLPADLFEVIVVDDGSGPETEAVIASASATEGAEVRSVRHRVSLGPAAARNSGWRAARARLVAFTDDDCCADPDWLRAALAIRVTAPDAVIQGRTMPDPSDAGDAGVFSRTVRVEQLGPQYETCNIIYPRVVLESLDGFDETFGPGPAAEDTDLAWRAIEAGRPTVFAGDAVVWHAVERLGFGGMLRVAWRWRRAMRIFAEHPATRSMLYRGVFWNVWHYLLWRSLLALAAPRWLRRLLLGFYVREMVVRARAQGAGPWAVPLLAVHDAVECVAAVTGSVRCRTLVL